MKRTSILILHGWQASTDKYLPLKTLFEKAGFKVFVPLLPGFGKEKSLPRVYDLDDYVRFVFDFAKKRKLESFFLIGHSFGGRVAIKLAALCPKRVGGLVLTGVPAIKSQKVKKLLFLLLAKLGKIIFTLFPFCFLKKWARKTLYRLAGEWDYYETKGAMRETFKRIVAENLLPFLSQIKVFTLLVWGEGDKTVPVSVAKRIVEKIPKAKLIVIPKATHKLPYENPKIFSKKCLEFFHSLL